MPHLAFLLLAGLLAGIAYAIKNREKQVVESAAKAEEAVSLESVDATWDDVMPVDALGLEVGFRLVPLVDSRHGGDLIKRIKALRKKFAQDVGFLTSIFVTT
jgi:flagellar biosynthesis protein FlhA